eukprot:scaffold4205_cov75-Cyclotella_meneghiniana.AAC.2
MTDSPQQRIISLHAPCNMAARLLLAALIAGSVKGQVTRTCSFRHMNPEDIYVENNASATRRLLRGWNREHTRALVKVANMNDATDRKLENQEGQANATTTPKLLPFKGLYCDCTGRLPTNNNFYCPVTSKSCEVWNGYGSGEEYTVTCTSENWMVAYARYMWYYLIFWFAFLSLSLLLTAPGQHAVKYIISRKFPSINSRLVDLIVELESSRQIQTQMSIAHERYLQRRREGWVIGYRLKTKRYNENEKRDKDKPEADCKASVQNEHINEADNANEEPVEEEKEPDVNINQTEDISQTNQQSSGLQRTDSKEPDTCTICLLDIEEGEKIADVQCGHMFHADCLSEWILKKNACPLCSYQGVAEEMREFEPESEFNPTRNVDMYPDTLVGRLRRRVHLTAIGDGYSVYGLGGRRYPQDPRGLQVPYF